MAVPDSAKDKSQPWLLHTKIQRHKKKIKKKTETALKKNPKKTRLEVKIFD